MAFGGTSMLSWWAVVVSSARSIFEIPGGSLLPVDAAVASMSSLIIDRISGTVQSGLIQRPRAFPSATSSAFVNSQSPLVRVTTGAVKSAALGAMML